MAPPGLRFISLFSLAAAAVLSAAGCRKSASPSPGATSPASSVPPALASYRPPENGVLTASQVRAFLGVRERMAANARTEDVPGPGAAGATEPPAPGEPTAASAERASELRAARALSMNTEEYLWVKERIVEVDAARTTARLNADVLTIVEKTLGELRSQRARVADDASRALIDEQLAAFQSEADRVRREAAEKDPEAVRANAVVLEPFRARLDVIRDEIARLMPPLKTPKP